MAGKRQFRRRREDAHRGAVAAVLRRRDEHGFRIIEFASDGLHRLRVEALAIEHHAERIAGKAFAGEDIERNEAAAHYSCLSVSLNGGSASCSTSNSRLG